MNRDDLFFALNATTQALRFAKAAAKYFTTDIDELEFGSKTAISVAYINNRLSDAQQSLGDTEEEIGRLIQQTPPSSEKSDFPSETQDESSNRRVL